MTITHTHPDYDSEQARHTAIQAAYIDLLTHLKSLQASSQDTGPRRTA